MRLRADWVPQAPEGNFGPVAPGDWLVVAEDAALGARLQAALRTAGLPAVAVRSPADVEPTGTPKLAGILFAAADESDAQAPPPEAALAALHRLAGMARRAHLSAAELWIVTRGASAAGPAPPSLHQAPIWGFCQALAAEHSPWGGLVDLDPAATDAAAEAEAVARIVAGQARGRALAIRAGRLLAPRLRRTSASDVTRTFHARPHAAVLITGGLGALGRQTARWLAAAGTRRLLLLGRSGRRAAGPQFPEFLAELTAKGVVVDVLEADVADARQLADALDAWRHANPEVPIRGVVHAAGVLARTRAATLDAAALEAGVEAKIAGAWNVHAAFPGPDDLDFLVLYSSAVAVLPSPGMSAYAAGNAFLDALAAWRRAGGLPALSVQWGPWEEGLATQVEDLPLLLKHFGVRQLTPRGALAELGDRLARPDDESVMTVVDADWAQVVEAHAALTGRGLEVASDLSGVGASAERSRTALMGDDQGGEWVLPAADPDTVLRFLVAEVAESLHLGTEVPADRPLRDLDLDSLMAMSLILGVERRWRVRFFPREVNDQPHLAGLAAYISSEIHLAHARAGASQDSAKPLEVAVPRLAATNQAPAASWPAPFEVSPGGARNESAAFILSSPRSGSTLLRVMLAGHPELFAPPELNLLTFSTLRERREALQGSYLDEGLQRALMHLLAIDAEASSDLVDEMVAQDMPVKNVYERLQQLARGRLLVDKSPAYAYFPDALRRAESLFDQPRYVFLVRHPGAVIESYVRNRVDRLVGDVSGDPQESAERVWATSNANIIDFLADMPPERCHLLRFEDLVSAPRDAAIALCRFLGIDFDESLLRPYEGNRMADGLFPTSLQLGDPGFHRHDDIDASLADAWRDRPPSRPCGPFVRRVAAELDYQLGEAVARAAAASVPEPTAAAARAGAGATASRAPISFIDGAGWQPLVALQPHGREQPLFLAHPASGAVFPYYELVRELGSDQPVYGLQDVAIGGVRDPLETIDAYAAEYVEAIRAVQPQGPYLLGGWSFGGHVAVAMARRLQEAGEKTTAVLLLDTEAPLDMQSLPLGERLLQMSRNAAMLRDLGEVVPYLRDGMFLLNAANRRRMERDPPKMGPIQSMRHAWKEAWRSRLAGDSPVGREMAAQRPEFLEASPRNDSLRAGFALLRHHFRLVIDDVPRPFAGDVVLFRAREQVNRRFHAPPDLGWKDLVRGRLQVHEVPGSHITMGRDPHVQHLAKAMRAEIARQLAQQPYSSATS